MGENTSFDDEWDPVSERWLTWMGKKLPLPRAEWPEDTPDFDAFSWYMNRQHPAEVAAGWHKARPENPRCGCSSWGRHWMDWACGKSDSEVYPVDWNGGEYLPLVLCENNHVIDRDEPFRWGSH